MIFKCKLFDNFNLGSIKVKSTCPRYRPLTNNKPVVEIEKMSETEEKL